MMVRGLVACMLCLLPLTSCAAGGPVKEPSVAGSFYPADAVVLGKTVDGFLSAVKKTAAGGRPLALLVPHAGYVFSGAVAAEAYGRVGSTGIKTVVVIAPSHRASFRAVALFGGAGMRTPLGTVEVNRSFVRRLVDDSAGVSVNAAAFDNEHAVEVQLPFIQRTMPGSSVVPILVSEPTQQSFDSLTGRLAALVGEQPDTLIVVSSDLSHYADGRTAAAKDAKMLAALGRLSIADAGRLLASGAGEMCGGYPMLYALAVLEKLGATEGRLFRYAHSGDVSGDTSRVVGYGAMGFYAAGLSADDRRMLLKFAREAVAAQVNGTPPPSAAASGPLAARGAAFVTLKDRNGMLRGCIGNISPVMPLVQSVIENARAACSRDTRFRPVTPAELAGLDVEVTVLSPLTPLSDVKELRIGTHGLLLRKGEGGAVFLPQVPVEQGWDVKTYLEQLALKAGLPPDGWKGASLSVFTADIIH